MGLTTKQRAADSMGGFDPSIYKKLPGLLTTPAAGTVGGSGGGGGNVVVGSGGNGGGNLGVGPGQGVSSNTQQTALSLISLADKYPAILPGGILAKLLGLLGGKIADSQIDKMAEAQKALEAIDKQNAAALESGSSRTFDPYGGTKGVMSVSDKDGNVRSFDPYAGDSAKDADRAAALSASLGPAPTPNVAPAADTSTAVPGISGLLGVDTALDNLGDRPESNPIASLPTLGYTGTTLGLLGDFLGGSAISLNPAPVETKEATPNPAQALQAQRDADAATASMGRDARVDAANRAAGNAAYGGGGGYGSGGGAGGSQPGGSGTGVGGYGPQAKGGLITPRDVKGPNPPGPDDGQASLDIGEYVIRKSAVKKYGSNIFEKINAGQIPAKRLKSLLE